MTRKILSILLALSMVLTLAPVQLSALPYYGPVSDPLQWAAPAPFAEAAAAGYFYNQLSLNAKIFYNALEQMYADGTLKSGTKALDLAVNADGTPVEQVQDLVAAHMIGRANLLSDYGAGRDAFYADYPGVFYVDFSALTLRITEEKNADGTTALYHLYLGAGRYPTYRTEGMEAYTEEQIDAEIEKYNAALNLLVAEGSRYTDPREQVIAVHDYLTHSVTYRDEVEIARKGRPQDAGFIRTAYGALVKHEGVCESYTRAFKAAMDALGIPCVMVSGVYRHDDKIAEAHIWNEVQIGGKWYGVDVTMDDPINPNPPAFLDVQGNDGFENQKYLLVGPDVMDVNHSPDGSMSPGGYEFRYPSIEAEISTIVEGNGLLKVRYSTEAYDTEILEAGTYYVSFMGMDCISMMDKGYYLIMKNKYYDVNDGWTDTDWYYFTPELYQGAFDAATGETKFALPHIEYVQFGVTTIPYPKIIPDKLPDLMFHGDVSLLVDQSSMLHNEYGGFRAAPASLHGEPAYNRGSLDIGKEQHLKAYYNDILVTPEVYEEWCKPRYEDKPEINAPLALGDDPEYDAAIRSATTEDFDLSVRVIDKLLDDVRTGEKYQSPIKNVQISFTDTETIIELDYTANNEWIDDSVAYEFIIDGLVGAYSGKKPDCFGWVAAYPCAICAYRSRGFDYNTMAKPVLVADQDLSLDGWVDQDGNDWSDTPWGDSYKNKLMLVVEDSSAKDSNNMEDMVGETGEDVLSALTYNINLTLCKLQWENLKDGMSVRIQLGFPEGFGPEDEGVTFKAYHFNKDPDTGEILEIQEIPCYITQYGLLIEVSSFSPFAICAVEKKPDAVPVSKNIVLTSDIGGKVVSAKANNGIITLLPNDIAEITVIPDPGYVLDSVEGSNLVAGKDVNALTFTISYDDIDGDMSLVNAKFVTETVALEEVGTAVIPEVIAPEAVTFASTEYTTEVHRPLTLTVDFPNDAYTYSWYETSANGFGTTDRLVGTGSSITIDYTETGVKSYYVTVTATAGATMAKSAPSNTITVNVIDAHQHVYTDTYHHNENEHYKVCTHVYADGVPCAVETEREPHVFDEKTGEVCTVCGYRKVKRGDLNGDGIVDVIDGVIMQRILSRLETDGVFIGRANLDSAGEIDVLDGVIMQRILSGLE